MLTPRRVTDDNIKMYVKRNAMVGSIGVSFGSRQGPVTVHECLFHDAVDC